MTDDSDLPPCDYTAFAAQPRTLTDCPRPNDGHHRDLGRVNNRRSATATAIVAMATDFIGLQVVVVVRDPPSKFKGTVSDISAGAGLTLSNGQWPPSSFLLPAAAFRLSLSPPPILSLNAHVLFPFRCNSWVPSVVSLTLPLAPYLPGADIAHLVKSGDSMSTSGNLG